VPRRDRIPEDGGPLIPIGSEEEQRSFDTTCPKLQLAKYLQAGDTTQVTINYSPVRTPYGTAWGDATCNGGGGCGVVFKLDNAGSCPLLYQIPNLHRRLPHRRSPTARSGIKQATFAAPPLPKEQTLRAALCFSSSPRRSTAPHYGASSPCARLSSLNCAEHRFSTSPFRSGRPHSLIAGAPAGTSTVTIDAGADGPASISISGRVRSCGIWAKTGAQRGTCPRRHTREERRRMKSGAGAPFCASPSKVTGDEL
jgi:hypothetical protein